MVCGEMHKRERANSDMKGALEAFWLFQQDNIANPRD
jgi:hypothetical protein